MRHRMVGSEESLVRDQGSRPKAWIAPLTPQGTLPVTVIRSSPAGGRREPGAENREPGAGGPSVIVIGAGAGRPRGGDLRGAPRRRPSLRVWCLDGARHVGAKILVSGGSRCNVTNTSGDPARLVGAAAASWIARAAWFPAGRRHRPSMVFAELGVPLHKGEATASSFPVQATRPDRPRGPVRAKRAAWHRHRDRYPRHRPAPRRPAGFVRRAERGTPLTARAVALATGGRSLPSGGRLRLLVAAGLRHIGVSTTPALAPLVLRGDAHRVLAGVAHPAAVTFGPAAARRARGTLLWTHFGVSGPVVLNLRGIGSVPAVPAAGDAGAARHRGAALGAPRRNLRVHRRWLSTRPLRVRRRRWPPCSAPGCPRHCRGMAGRRQSGPRVTISHLQPRGSPAVRARPGRFPLDVDDSRGYTFAEVTPGGVPLEELTPATLE